MIKQILEYVWIDGNGELRSKIKINCDENVININELNRCELWNFDGSSTNQPSNITSDITYDNISDIILNPVRLYYNTLIKSPPNALFVFCECLNKDLTPHISNFRKKCKDTNSICETFECFFGIEQEYVIFERNNTPYKWKDLKNPGLTEIQGPYYCSVGGDRNFGRQISNEHLSCCIESNINICGTNSEVMASQWEYQIGVCDALQVSDDLYMSRYLLHRISEKYDCYISFHPKPLENWNGSGGHTNFSTNKMREINGIDEIYEACKKLKKKHLLHIVNYGEDNDKRLSGKFETSSMKNFSYGVGDRSCSIRIPLQVNINKCGYLEDRRPAANLNPYIVTELLINSILL